MKTLKWLIAAPILAFILFNVYAYGSIISYRALAPHRTAFMNMRMSEIAQEKPQVALSYQWVPYNQIAENLKKALIASEDANFAEHDGFDWNGIKNAIKKNEKSGKIKAGGSTISQQLAKNLFLNESRSYWRKAEEAALTAMLEATTDKDRIYTLYLNVIEWGYGIYGAEAASQYFYKQSAAQAQQNSGCPTRRPRAQTAVLHDHPNDKGLRHKTNIILRRMGSATLPE